MGKIFLTGASGFIGSNLTGKLISAGHEVYALSRKTMDTTNKNMVSVVGDILKPETFTATIKYCDAVFHCAAYVSFHKNDFHKAFDVNVTGTKNILEAAYRADIKKVVHLSACAVLGYSNNKGKVIDETAHPVIEKDNVYAHTKKSAEEVIDEYVRKGLDISIANISTVYGQGDNKLNSGSIIKSIYENRLKFVPPGGTSYVAVDDLVEGLLLLAEKGKAGERYIFSTENLEYADLAGRIARTLEVESPKFVLPRISYYPVLLAANLLEIFSGLKKSGVNLMTGQIVKETYHYKYFSSQKARKELGWKPSRRLEDAVSKAFAFYKERGLIR